MGEVLSLQQGIFQIGLTAECCEPAAFPAGEGINPSILKGGLGRATQHQLHLSINTSELSRILLSGLALGKLGKLQNFPIVPHTFLPCELYIPSPVSILELQFLSMNTY